MSQYQAAAAHVAAQHGIPKGIFLALVNQESGFNPKARSGAGAYGLTQLMPATAKSLGVNLADPLSQLEGGARYLKAQFDKFGNWKLALAAYNAGPGRVQDGTWSRIPETAHYVTAIMGSTGKYGGVEPPQSLASASQAASAASAGAGVVPQVAPVLHGTQGFDTHAFAQDQFSHLGDPGYALQNLASGAYETPQVAQPFSATLTGLHGTPQIPHPVGNQQTLPGSRIRAGKFDYPLGAKGRIIGTPYQGTHTQFGNWESDNAIDISAPKGTPVYAVADGTIGSQIGALGTSSSQLAGLRVHLQTGGNEFYYAHLSKLAVAAGQKVKKGQLIGYSGEANGVGHLHIASKSGNPLSFFRGHK